MYLRSYAQTSIKVKSQLNLKYIYILITTITYLTSQRVLYLMIVWQLSEIYYGIAIPKRSNKSADNNFYVVSKSNIYEVKHAHSDNKKNT
jgi:hypothetical protein